MKNKNINVMIYYTAHIVLGILIQFGAVYLLNTATRIAELYSIGSEELANYGEVIDSLSVPSPGMIIYVIFAAPLIEELVFRFGLIGLGKKICKFWIVNIISALLFGFYHGNLTQGIYAFILGLVLGILFQYGSGFISSFLVHMMLNATGLAINDKIEQHATIAGDFITGIAFTIAVTLLVFVIIRMKKQRESV